MSLEPKNRKREGYWKGKKRPNLWKDNKHPLLGKPSPLKGRKLSEETKRKIRKARAKQVFSIGTRAKLSKVRKKTWEKLKQDPVRYKKWKEKVSKGNKGRKANSGSFKSGEKHPNWQGGKKPQDELLRNTTMYRKWCKKVYERDNFTCQSCGKKDDLSGHHIKTFTESPELRFSVDNGITLCKKCHMEEHRQMLIERYREKREKILV